MARILVNNSLVSFPMGGINLWAITWVVGLRRLGHDVYLIDENEWNYSCFDNERGIWSQDYAYGLRVVQALLDRYGLGDRWSFTDFDRKCHGLSRSRVDELFRTADAFIDLEWGTSYDRAGNIPIRIFIDSEPGWGQIKIVQALDKGERLRDYHYFYTAGLNIGTEVCSVPTGGIEWRHVPTPVLLDHPADDAPKSSGRFTTVMNWASGHNTYEYQGKNFGNKGLEFDRFIKLPQMIDEEIELAVSGTPPIDRLIRNGWTVRDANEVARSVDTFRSYVERSKGEFSVAKNSFFETQCGWWGDRAGVYLSYGKPVVLQDAGFSRHIPCGEGLFAVSSVEEAADAIGEINSDYRRHSHAARELAEQYLCVEKVLGKLLSEVGIH